MVRNWEKTYNDYMNETISETAAEKAIFEANLEGNLSLKVKYPDGSEFVYKVSNYHLACCSEYFHDLFNEDKAHSIETTIEESSPKLVKEMMRYLDYAAVEDMNEICHDLMLLAIKYKMKLLKEMCFNFIELNLSKDNVLKTLTILHQVLDHSPVICKHVEDRVFIDALEMLVE